MLKSPSDSTLYAPAVPCNGLSPQTKRKVDDRPEVNTEMITEFIKRIRLDSSSGTTESRGGDSGSARVRSEVRVPPKDKVDDRSRGERAREDAKRMIVQAEKYKAELIPEGMLDKLKDIIQSKADEDFYHNTCHIEKVLREKIEKGAYVDLVKLLVRNKSVQPDSGKKIMKEREDGVVYFANSEDVENKITNVHKWEQAFRAYATIYSKANPSRASEVLMYIDSIHHAAKIAPWESVAHYDYCFRQLMEEYPDRNWGKTYVQKWTTMLCEGKQIQTASGTSKGKSQSNDWKDNTCWRYNKSRCRYGLKCRFDHRCTYCASYNHPYQYCPKRLGRRSGDRSDRHERSEMSDRSPRRDKHERSKRKDKTSEGGNK